MPSAFRNTSQAEVVRDVLGDYEYSFVSLRSVNLTGSTYADLIVSYPGGASAGPMEVWVYQNGSYTKHISTWGWGAEVGDHLGLGYPQIASSHRDYGQNRRVTTVWCWTGNTFVPIVKRFGGESRNWTENLGEVNWCRRG